eukprot:TRINITY_DN2638_c0_g2_i1.p2 TRINITY_DN2638_c0_g2~~TRINITY_DN2638_c0_g2_i1.p2  ORF type:complete len:215 (+),score=-3.96 TRINITY_DN2638_c0_g2_i1:134-778(+)
MPVRVESPPRVISNEPCRVSSINQRRRLNLGDTPKAARRRVQKGSCGQQNNLQRLYMTNYTWVGDESVFDANWGAGKPVFFPIRQERKITIRTWQVFLPSNYYLYLSTKSGFYYVYGRHFQELGIAESQPLRQVYIKFSQKPYPTFHTIEQTGKPQQQRKISQISFLRRKIKISPKAKILEYFIYPQGVRREKESVRSRCLFVMERMKPTLVRN